MLAASSVLASQQALAAPFRQPQKQYVPKIFGAKGDGLADDTNQSKKAINSGADEIIFLR